MDTHQPEDPHDDATREPWWRRTLRALDEKTRGPRYQAHHERVERGHDLIKQGQLRAGLVEVGRAWAPLIVAALVAGAVVYSGSKAFAMPGWFWGVAGGVAGLAVAAVLAARPRKRGDL